MVRDVTWRVETTMAAFRHRSIEVIERRYAKPPFNSKLTAQRFDKGVPLVVDAWGRLN